MDLGSDGLGVAHVDDLEVRVEDGLPGETGAARVLHVGRRRAYARLEERRRDAPARRSALPCPRWTPASPCRLMHLDPGGQLAFARERVARALAAVDVPVSSVRPALAAPRDLGWRARALYVAARREERVLLGAYRRRSHVVQDMAGCPLEEPAVTAVAGGIAALMSELGLPVSHPRRPVASDAGCGAPLGPSRRVRPGSPRPERVEDGLCHVALRASAGGDVAVVLLTPSGELRAEALLAARLRERHPEVVAVHVGATGPEDVVFGAGPLRAVGPAEPFVDDVGDLRLEVSPRAFLQANRGAADLLHGLAVEHAAPGPAVDVYCGVGALTLRLARAGHDAVGVEVVEEAVRDARANAERNGIDNARFVCDDAARGLAALDERVESVFLNPPRKGCGREVLDRVVALGPERVVYLSCNPDTLARDLAVLTAAGRRVEGVQPVPFFPHSEHVESLAWL